MKNNAVAADPAREIAYGYVIYQLVASVLGAFAIAIFLGHFIHTNWHGLLATQAAIWNWLVAPVQNFTFAQLEMLTGEKFEPFWRDYLTVGAVALLSFARASLAFDMSSTANRLLRWGELILDLASHLLLWPIAFVRAFLGIFEKDPEHAPYILVLSLTPLFYAAALFTVNAWLA